MLTIEHASAIERIIPRKVVYRLDIELDEFRDRVRSTLEQIANGDYAYEDSDTDAGDLADETIQRAASDIADETWMDYSEMEDLLRENMDPWELEHLFATALTDYLLTHPPLTPDQAAMEDNSIVLGWPYRTPRVYLTRAQRRAVRYFGKD